MPIDARTIPACLAIAAAALGAPAGWAQAPDDTPASLAPRQWTVAAGLGNSMGWFGMQGERHDGRNRASAFVGIGYTPAIDAGDPSGVTFAAGVRGFTPGERHRGFLELAVSQIAIDDGAGRGRYYGPALQAGYHYTARHGFTFLLSGGVGRALGVDEAVTSSRWLAVLGAGAGYTWRR